METINSIKNHLIAYYPLHNDGQNYLDGGERDNDDSNLKFAKGKFGPAADFTFQGSVLQLKYPRNNDVVSYSMSAFVKIKSLDLVEKGGFPPPEWVTIAGMLRLRIKDAHILYYYPFEKDGTLDARKIVSNRPISLNEWHSIMVECSKEQGFVNIYIDGRLDAHEKLNIDGDFTPKLYLDAIGGEHTRSEQTTMNGWMCHFVIMNITLWPDAINVLAGKQRFPNKEAAQRVLGHDKNPENPNEPRAIGMFALACIGGIAALGTGLYKWIFSGTENGSDDNDADQLNSNAENLADRIRSIVGEPATRDKSLFPTRKRLGLKHGELFHLDVGGEGYHVSQEMKAGFDCAVNLNAQDTNSQTGERIPALIKVDDWNSKPPYPVADNTVDKLTMQGAPLFDWAVPEMARVLRTGGTIGLWIDDKSFKKQIEDLSKLIPGSTIEWNARDDEFGYSWPKTKIIDHRPPVYDDK